MCRYHIIVKNVVTSCNQHVPAGQCPRPAGGPVLQFTDNNFNPAEYSSDLFPEPPEGTAVWGIEYNNITKATWWRSDKSP